MQCLFACTALWDSCFLSRQTSSVQYPLTWCFFFHSLIFLLACFTFIFILLALSLGFPVLGFTCMPVMQQEGWGIKHLGISFGLFFLIFFNEIARGHLQSSWWNSLRLLALDDNSF